jgi:hypothetical protein
MRVQAAGLHHPENHAARVGLLAVDVTPCGRGLGPVQAAMIRVE